MAKEYSREIAAAVNDFLSDDDWKYWFDDRNGAFRFTLDLGSKIKTVNFSVLVHKTSYLVHADFPIGAAKGDRACLARLAEFTCRANYGLRNGNFELDFRDGEVSYKSYVDCEDLIPSRAVVANSIYSTATMCRRYAPAILAAVLSDDDIAQAVEDCETDYSSTPSPEDLEAALAGLRESEDGTGEDSDVSLDELESLLASLADDDDTPEDDD